MTDLANLEVSLRFSYSTKLADMADGVAMQPVRRSKSLPCDRKRKVAPSLGPATRTAARSKCLLLAVESGGQRIASGKTALKALLLMLLMHTHHAQRTTTWTEAINCTFADEQTSS